MTSAVENYLAARAEFWVTNRRVSALVKVILQVGDDLRHHREEFSFPDLPSIKLPLTYRSYGVSACEWMTAEQIQVLLRDYHVRREKMVNAWQQVPDSQREGLQTPGVKIA